MTDFHGAYLSGGFDDNDLILPSSKTTVYVTVFDHQIIKQEHELNLEVLNVHNTGRARLIRSHSSARFCFELSGNSN